MAASRTAGHRGALLATSIAQVRNLEGQLQACLGQHPAAEIVLSQPGTAPITPRLPAPDAS